MKQDIVRQLVQANLKSIIEHNERSYPLCVCGIEDGWLRWKHHKHFTDEDAQKLKEDVQQWSETQADAMYAQGA